MRTLLADGPLKQETEFVLHLDGTTVGEVDLDKLGGKTSATSKIVSETTLMSYLKKPDSQEIFVTANRTLYSGKKKQTLFFGSTNLLISVIYQNTSYPSIAKVSAHTQQVILYQQQRLTAPLYRRSW